MSTGKMDKKSIKKEPFTKRLWDHCRRIWILPIRGRGFAWLQQIWMMPMTEKQKKMICKISREEAASRKPDNRRWLFPSQVSIRRIKA